MKRIILLACAVGLVVSVGVAGAYFNAQRSIADNVIRAGTVSVSVEPTSSAVSIDTLAPGTAQVRSLRVTNDGTLPCTVSVTNARRAGITAFYNALECSVSSGGTEVYRGLLSQMKTEPVPLAPGESIVLDFAVLLPGGADNSHAGDYTRMTLYVDAQQQR